MAILKGLIFLKWLARGLKLASDKIKIIFPHGN